MITNKTPDMFSVLFLMKNYKTQYMTIAVLVSGISNIILNSVLNPVFIELGAAISFVSSYIIMALLAWMINRYIVKLHATPFGSLLIPLLISTPFNLMIFYTNIFQSFTFTLFIKGLLVCTMTGILFFKERENIFFLIKGLYTSQ